MTLTAAILGARIRDAIAASGKNQQSAAAAAGMDATALSKVLTGKRSLSTLEISRISEVLGVSVLVLLDDGKPPPHPSSESAGRVRWMAELSMLLTDVGYPPSRDHRYPATLLDRAVEAWLAGHISIRPVAGLIGADADDLLARLPQGQA